MFYKVHKLNLRFVNYGKEPKKYTSKWFEFAEQNLIIKLDITTEVGHSILVFVQNLGQPRKYLDLNNIAFKQSCIPGVRKVTRTPVEIRGRVGNVLIL